MPRDKVIHFPGGGEGSVTPIDEGDLVSLVPRDKAFLLTLASIVVQGQLDAAHVVALSNLGEVRGVAEDENGEQREVEIEVDPQFLARQLSLKQATTAAKIKAIGEALGREADEIAARLLGLV